MEVKIGVRQVQREVVVETDESAASLEARAAETLAAKGILRLNDTKGRVVLVPAEQIAYLELGEEHVRKVGFGAV